MCVLYAQSQHGLFVLPSLLCRMNTSNHSGGIGLFSPLFFIASHPHEETNRPLIPMKDSLARSTAESQFCGVVSDASVPQHQICLALSRQMSGVNRLRFPKVSPLRDEK